MTERRASGWVCLDRECGCGCVPEDPEIDAVHQAERDAAIAERVKQIPEDLRKAAVNALRAFYKAQDEAPPRSWRDPVPDSVRKARELVYKAERDIVEFEGGRPQAPTLANTFSAAFCCLHESPGGIPQKH